MAGPFLPSWLMPGLTAAVVLPLAVACAPLFLTGLRPSWLRSWFETDERKIRSLRARCDVQEICAQLVSAGFLPLGVRVEQWPLFGRSRSLEYVLPGEAICASVFRVAGRTVIHLFTSLEPHAFALTTNGRCRPEDTNDYVHTVVSKALFDQLMVAHRKSIQRLVERGYVQRNLDSQESRVASVAAYYRHPAVQQAMRRQVRGLWAFYLLAAIVAAWVLCV